ncbi:MAG TPA: hypothetical protein VN861_03495 [Candidatus Acidoferrales bacterium]|nr:hypothetical protein [Candidatus Acidoferrales bacterium]
MCALNLNKPQPRAESQSSSASVINRSPRPSNGNSSSTHKSTFVRADKPLTKRIIISLTGEEKTGKNHTSLTAPSPIYVHSFDIGLDGVVQKFQDEKKIYVADYELTVQPGEASAGEVAEAADKVWQQFVSNYRDGLASCGNGTTVVDTDTELYELLRLARFGKLTQIMPHHYGPVNAELRDVIRESYDHDANVFFLSKKCPVWENYIDSTGKEKGRKTGELARKGFGDLAFLVQVVATTVRDDTPEGTVFNVEIEDCRFNPAANGQIVLNDYDSIMGAIFG